MDPKDPRMNPKKTKKEKISIFLRFKAVFVKFLIDIVNKNVENVQQGTNSLSNSLLIKDKCCFPEEKDLKLTLK